MYPKYNNTLKHCKGEYHRCKQQKIKSLTLSTTVHHYLRSFSERHIYIKKEKDQPMARPKYRYKEVKTTTIYDTKITL